MIYCEFESDGKGKVTCTECGKSFSHPLFVKTIPSRVCKRPPPCPHLGPPIEGDTLKLLQLCNTCKGRVRMKINEQVCQCEIYDRCLPNYRKTESEELVSGEWAHPCHGCQDNPNVTAAKQ